MLIYYRNRNISKRCPLIQRKEHSGAPGAPSRGGILLGDLALLDRSFQPAKYANTFAVVKGGPLRISASGKNRQTCCLCMGSCIFRFQPRSYCYLLQGSNFCTEGLSLAQKRRCFVRVPVGCIQKPPRDSPRCRASPKFRPETVFGSHVAHV